MTTFRRQAQECLILRPNYPHFRPKSPNVSKKEGKFIPPGGDQGTQWEKKWFWPSDTQHLDFLYCQGQQGSAVNTSSSTHIWGTDLGWGKQARFLIMLHLPIGNLVENCVVLWCQIRFWKKFGCQDDLGVPRSKVML